MKLWGERNGTRVLREGGVSLIGLVIGLTAAGVLFAIFIRRGDDTGPNAAAVSALPGSDAYWRVLFTGDTRGYIHPCGCEQGQFGGLPRRATLLARARKPGDLLLDLGNIIQGERPHDRLRLNYVLEGLKRLEYDFLVPGKGELAFGEDFERVALGLERPKVICANLVHSATGERVYEPWGIHELQDGRKVAVVGITSPYQPLPGRYKVLPPSEAVASAIKTLDGLADAVIVAGYVEGKPALDLAKEFPAVSLILGSLVPKGSPTLLERDGAPVMLGGERGQYVSWIGFDERLAPRRGGQHWMGEDVKDAPEFRQLIDRHDREVSRLGEAFARDAIAAFRSEGRVGSESCRECHQAEYDVWAASKHAHAMETLRAKGQERNPNCMKCHLQDVPKDGGVVIEAVAGIGCESCHGGGAPHAEAMTGGIRGVRLGLFRETASGSCVSCHDGENSRDFEFEAYWARIRHGDPALQGGK